MPYVVPQKLKWYQNSQYWYPLLKATTDANPMNDFGLNAVYYDALTCVFNQLHYANDSATFTLAMMASVRTPYRDYYVTPNAVLLGNQIFCKGLTSDYLFNSNAASKTAVNKIYTGGCPWIATTGYNEAHLPDIFYSRECAYALMAMLEQANCGNTIDTARRDVLKGYCMGHITNWGTTQADGLTKFFLRPFMVALTSKALIQYDNQVSGGLSQSERTKIVNIWDYIYNNLWQYANAAGTSSFAYTDRATSTMSSTNPNTSEQSSLVNTGDTEGSINLNLLIVPAYGWCWYQTGAQKWRDRFETIFVPALSTYDSYDPTYSGGGHWVSGAYFGAQTTGGIDGKSLNQNYFWSYDGINYAEATPISNPTNPVGGSAPVSFGLMGGNVYGTSVVKYGIAGQVTLSGVGQSGVTISSTALGNTTTDTNGNYSYTNVSPGTAYTITPSLSGYAFTPSSSSGTLNANATINFTSAVSSYNPATFYTGATQRYWFDSTDSSKVLNASGTSASSGVKVQTVTDEAGGALSMLQATVANQGAVDTGLGTNSKQALKVTGSPITYALSGTGNTAALKAATKVSFGVTFKLLGTAANARFHRQVDSTFSDNIFNASLAGAQPAMDMAVTSSGQTTSISNQTLSVGSIYFVLYEWDVANHTGNIYVNGTGGLGTSAFPTGSVIENLNANTAPDLLSVSNVEELDRFLMVGALCSNISGLTTAIRNKIGF